MSRPRVYLSLLVKSRRSCSLLPATSTTITTAAATTTHHPPLYTPPQHPFSTSTLALKHFTMSKRDSPPTGGQATAQEHPELSHPSTKRAKQIDKPGSTPFDALVLAGESQEENTKVTAVAHWFRSKDLRLHDNVALHRASQLAREKNVPLISFYLHCAAEFEWHGTSPARTDFLRRALEDMQSELEGGGLKIPLVFIDAPERKDKLEKVLEFVRKNGISHLFANYEYEVDEVRRDTEVMQQLQQSDGKTQFTLFHDQTIVEPGSMETSGGKPQKVFTPFHKNWLAVVADDPSLLDVVPAPEANDAKAANGLDKLFGSKLPAIPESKRFTSEDDAKRIRKLWPAGHDAGISRLHSFLKDKVGDYAATRSQPAADSTSRLSAYFAAGMVSIREALSAAKEANGGSANFGGGAKGNKSDGIAAWVREICFRELYRQALVVTPHNAMNLPQNLKFEFVQWETDEEGWKKWCDGTTGVPFVDAGMRQLRAEAYMHNRLRMNVSSYLTLNLLIDYRRGERYFAETLVDWDLANNTQGWEPSYTVFNPTSQAERNDPDGEYIRHWVPELKNVEGKAVFAPHERLSEEEFKKLGYPKPHVDWKETKQRAMERFKNDMSGVEP